MIVVSGKNNIIKPGSFGNFTLSKTSHGLILVTSPKKPGFVFCFCMSFSSSLEVPDIPEDEALENHLVVLLVSLDY